MKRLMIANLLIVLLFSLLGLTTAARAETVSASAPNTYTVMVGEEDVSQAVSVMSFFPEKVTIHVGDVVTWKANSHEIHTVTFLAGGSMPDLIIGAPADLASISPLQINPLVAFPIPPAPVPYDGKSYVNSGLMSTDPGMVPSFSLTFTQPGTYEYVCLVHGMMMSGTVTVVAPSVPVISPATVANQARAQMQAAWARVPGVLAQARKQIVPPVKNPDGTTTHTVMIGYSSGVIDVMRFFPSTVNAKPGDTIVWKLSSSDVAPHTVTFPNGHEDSGLVLPVPQPNGPPVLLFNPQILFPSLNSLPVPQALNATDFFNSGLMDPVQGPTSFAYKVGNVSGTLDYECLLHDTSGMVGKVVVGN